MSNEQLTIGNYLRVLYCNAYFANIIAFVKNNKATLKSAIFATWKVCPIF